MNNHHTQSVFISDFSGKFYCAYIQYVDGILKHRSVYLVNENVKQFRLVALFCTTYGAAEIGSQGHSQRGDVVASPPCSRP